MHERHEHVFRLLIEQLLPLVDTAHPLIVGVTGSVAVGKSHFAASLATELLLHRGHADIDVVSVDSFLLPNSVLHERGISMRKGFPESFDREALAAFLAAARTCLPGRSTPVHDHFAYDIVDGMRRPVGGSTVLIVEGLCLLGPGAETDDGPVARHLDVSVYLDAEEADIERWYTDRFMGHVAAAADQPGGFWDLFAGMTPEHAREVAAMTWAAINLPNLRDHVAPGRALADIVVSKFPDHRLRRIERRRG